MNIRGPCVEPTPTLTLTLTLTRTLTLTLTKARLGWAEAGLPTDGKALDREMMAQYKVPTAKRIFGLEMGGMRAPSDADDDY